jgi:predicted N-acetyltransferase YhbS
VSRLAFKFRIRKASEAEYSSLGQLIVAAYRAIPGTPSSQECPEFWRQLRAVAERARHPGVTVFAAVDDESGEILGCVDFIDQSMNGTVAIRLLAVGAEWRGLGVGRALTRHCLSRARSLGRADVVLESRSLPCRLRAQRFSCLCRVGENAGHSSGL